MTWLYVSAILAGACLLFVVQPLCAKMLLPMLGGTPAAWTTCMVFFQAGLLIGYAYAHAGPRWLGVRVHAILHLLLLTIAFFTLPIKLPEDVAEGWHPIPWLLMSLTLAIGLPFVLLSAGAPLLQRWFAFLPSPYGRGIEGPRDPYFLYAASNLGSFLGLALFPGFFELFLTSAEQSEWWRFGFLACIILVAACVPWRASGEWTSTAVTSPTPIWSERGRWIMLALIPSSLLLSVTTHLTTDIAAIPLLWLVPMALYLLTFTLVFAKRPLIPHTILIRWLPLVVIVLMVVMLMEASEPMLVVMAIHLLGFFWLAMVCHGELSRTRPQAEHLTDFYLCLAIGGVLGGALNALIAPLVFPGLFEYPLMIALACLFGLERALQSSRDDWGWAAVVGGGTVALLALAQWGLKVPAGPLSVGAIFGLPLIVCYAAQTRPARFALCIACVLLASGFYHGIHGAAAFRERSYFGIHRVTEVNGLRRLVHGNTVHGQEAIETPRPHVPLTYYSHDGPIGQLFRSLQGDRRLEEVGIVGLGAGSLAYYADKGQTWTYFEIDPSVKRIAEDPKLFTFVHDSRGDIHVEIGDARLQLKKSSRRFGVLVVDAFGSDAIPVHLLTREALRIYLDRLGHDGILAFHISNNYVDLEPVLANLAKDVHPPCVAYLRKHEPSKEQLAQGIMSSHWLVLARSDADLEPVLKSNQWLPARARPSMRVWTDDFSNLLQVFRW